MTHERILAYFQRMSNYHWVNLSDWITLSPAKRGELEASIKAQGGTVAIDINDSTEHQDFDWDEKIRREENGERIW